MICKHQVVGKTKEGYFFVHPCGQCLNCLINNMRAWFVRSHFELKKKDRPYHYFLTLTYNDENLPSDGFCKKEDLKKFLNNLNTSFGLHLRYFATADYGSINNRPHYHAILLSEKRINQQQVERIWKRGFVYLKPSNTDNIKYTLRYTVKKKPIKGNEKGFFRLISKGWGNNVKDYYTGQEYFIIDGRKYGISSYLREKIGLDKPKKRLYFSYADYFYSKEHEYLDNFEKSIEDDFKLNEYRRKLNESI